MQNILFGTSCSLRFETPGIKRDIEKNVETVKFAKEDRELEMRTVYDGMVKKLESQLKNKLNTLKGQKNSICNETEFLEKILGTVEREVSALCFCTCCIFN